MDDKNTDLKVTMDFLSDFAQWAGQRLAEAGYRGIGDKPDEVIIQYLNASRRRISKKPRTVLFSQEFKCPLEHQAGLDEIVRKAISGEDLTPHQSRYLFDAGFDDDLLNDWDVQHLHLGTGPHAIDPRLVEGTAQLLYARVTPETLYCIDVFDHQFNSLRLMKILQHNWPDSISHVRSRDVVGDKFTDENIKTMRKVKCNTIIDLSDGTSYHPIGGGYASSGTSIRVMFDCHQIVKYCRAMEASVREYLIHANTGGEQVLPSYEFKLAIRDGRISAIDARAGITINFSLPL